MEDRDRTDSHFEDDLIVMLSKLDKTWLAAVGLPHDGRIHLS